MSARMQYPLSQRRHTNIAVVRYQKNGVRLEVACYKNKVISYRSGTEDRLDEVLQVDRIFSNVGRGYVASKEDIAAVFGDDMTEKDAIKFMLEHGELQVAQQERVAEVDEISKDIAIIISQKCVNAKTQRPFPTVVIEQALKSIGAGVKLDQPVKKQALSLIHQLIESQIIPIARANMKLRCLTPTEAGVAILDQWCSENEVQVLERKTAMVGGTEDESKNRSQHSLLLLLQPNLFRDLDTLLKTKLPTGSSMHTVDAAVMEVGEGDAALVARAATALSSAGAGADSLDLESSEGHGPQTQQQQQRISAKGRRGNKGNSLATSTVGGDEGGHDSDSDDGARGRKRAGKKGGKKVKDGASAAQPAPPAAVAGSDALTAELMKLGLDPAADLRADDDSAEEGRGRGKKGKGAKGGKGGKAKSKTVAKSQKAADSDDAASKPTDSDEELEVNRRQRKKNTQQQQHKRESHHNAYKPSEDEFDYGEDDEEGEAVRENS